MSLRSWLGSADYRDAERLEDLRSMQSSMDWLEPETQLSADHWPVEVFLSTPQTVLAAAPGKREVMPCFVSKPLSFSLGVS